MREPRRRGAIAVGGRLEYSVLRQWPGLPVRVSICFCSSDSFSPICGFVFLFGDSLGFFCRWALRVGYTRRVDPFASRGFWVDYPAGRSLFDRPIWVGLLCEE